jgi:hypothetical protein
VAAQRTGSARSGINQCTCMPSLQHLPNLVQHPTTLPSFCLDSCASNVITDVAETCLMIDGCLHALFKVVLDPLQYSRWASKPADSWPVRRFARLKGSNICLSQSLQAYAHTPADCCRLLA